MFARSSIRAKLLISTAMLFFIVAALSFGGIKGVMSYRGLVRAVSDRAAELPLAAELTQSIHDLRNEFGNSRSDQWDGSGLFFTSAIGEVEDRLRRYEEQLKKVEENGSGIVNLDEELATVVEVKASLNRIRQGSHDSTWVRDQYPFDTLLEDLESITEKTRELPSHLHRRMQALKGEVRGQYRYLSILTWTTSFLALAFMFLLVKFFYDGILGPLNVLVEGSRRVAAGDFGHRISQSTNDEMSQLANAMNEKTSTRTSELLLGLALLNYPKRKSSLVSSMLQRYTHEAQ